MTFLANCINCLKKDRPFAMKKVKSMKPCISHLELQVYHFLLSKDPEIYYELCITSIGLNKIYVISVTESEIRKGLLERNEDYKNLNCVCIMRTITDLHDQLDKYKARQFINLKPNSTDVDNDAYKAVMKLKDEVEKNMPEGSMFKESLKWEEPSGVATSTHKDYTERLCNFFFNLVRDKIDENIKLHHSLIKDELYSETLQHWETVKVRCKNFIGRKDVLQNVKDYILGDTNHVLVIHGESGCGKTSIIAKAAADSLAWLRQSGKMIQTSVFVRFLGTTPCSSTVGELLRTLCHQIAYSTGRQRHEIPTDFKGMKRYFRDVVKTGDFRGLIVIFLDSLDQLSPEDGAHKLDWLPAQLSNNLKIVVSALPEKYGIYNRLQQKVTDNNYHIKVLPMEVGVCSDIVHVYLDQNQRSIQYNQWKFVKDSFDKCSLPLFAKLTFEEVINWKSYTKVDENTLAVSVSECIDKLFDRLENKYGEVFVSHALGYLTASKGGISHTEMEDMLSLDDVVLNSVFSHWEPPIRRIPPVLWPRLHHEISHYLTEREEDEVTVVYWYHQQFIDAATERYLGKFVQSSKIHHVMADYFKGVWSKTVKKPFTYPPELQKRLRLNSAESSACRFVPDQPFSFSTFNTEKRYNLRKLNHLPFHLVKALRKQEAKNDVFFNYAWIFTKICACSVQQAISDFNLVEDREVSLVADALRVCQTALAHDPNLLGPELTGRLLPHYNKYENITKLITQCDVAAITHCPLVPNWQIYTTPGGPLEYVCETEIPESSSVNMEIANHQDGVLLLARQNLDTSIKVWDVEQKEPKPEIHFPGGSCITSTPNGTYVVSVRNKKYLQTFHVDSWEPYGEVDFGYGNIVHMDVSNKYAALCLEHTPGPVIIDMAANMLLHKFQYKSTLTAVSPDEKFILCNHGNCLIMHEFPLMTRKSVVNNIETPSKIIFCKDTTKFYVMSKDGSLKFVSVDLIRHNAKSTGIITDIGLKDFILGFKKENILVRTQRCLYIFSEESKSLKYRIQKMPPGAFVEALSTFKEARFSQNDKLIVAARYVYIGVWSAADGTPVRLLQSAISPIQNLFTNERVNKAITLLEDHSIQVWNLDDLDADVNHLNSIVKGSIKGLAFARDSVRYICHGFNRAEAKVGNILTNEFEWTLVHSEDTEDRIDEVLMSPNGQYAVTSAPSKDYFDIQKSLDILKEDKLWDLKTGEVLCTVGNNRNVVFSADCNKVVFVLCRTQSSQNPSFNLYDLFVVDGSSKEQYLEELPQGDIVGNPVMPGKGSHLVYIIQQTEQDSTSTSIRLCAYSFTKQWKGAKLKDIRSVWSKAEQTDNFLDVRTINDTNILITFGRGFSELPYKEDGSINRDVNLTKGAFIYNAQKDWLIRVIEVFLSPNSNLCTMLVSSRASVIVDDNYNVYEVSSGDLLTSLDIDSIVFPGTSQLVLDGKYLVALSRSRRDVVVIRTSDGRIMGKCPIHGQGTCLKIGYDERTVAVGCSDGRVMILTVILESPDANQEIISRLRSRKQRRESTVSVDGITKKMSIGNVKLNDSTKQMNGSSKPDVLTSDINQLTNVQDDIRRLSAATRKAKMEETKRINGYKAVGQGVLLTQHYNRVKTSQACVIQ